MLVIFAGRDGLLLSQALVLWKWTPCAFIHIPFVVHYLSLGGPGDRAGILGYAWYWLGTYYMYLNTMVKSHDKHQGEIPNK